MSIFSEWVNRLRYAGRRVRFDHELDDEIRFHLETRAADLEQSGLSRDDARAQARREFGSATRMREESRSAWQVQWLEDLGADLRILALTRLMLGGDLLAARARPCRAGQSGDRQSQMIMAIWRGRRASRA